VALVADGSVRRWCCTPVARRRSLTTSDGSGPCGTNRIRKSPSSLCAAPTWPFWSFLAERSTADRSRDRLEREREAERPGRGPGLGVTPSRSAQRLGANRSGHVYRLCARAIRRSTSTTAHVPRNPEGVPVYSAKRISNQRYRLERAASGDSRGPVTPLCEAEFACSAEGFLPV